MAIADKLQAALNSKNDIKAALTEKDQSPTDVFSTYANLIRNIETSVDGENITADLAEQTATADELVAIAKRKYFETLNTGIYVWKKLTAEGGDFIEYVVSGESTTYPDGGTQDVYWYELFDPATLIPNNIREGVDIFGVLGTLTEGVSGIDWGTITMPSSSKSMTFTHNLGVKPSRVIVTRTSLPAPYPSYTFLINNNQFVSGENGYYGDNGLSSTCTAFTATDTTVTITIDGAYLTGTHYWFAIA